MTHTMEPVMKHGRSSWDRALMPADEFDERRQAVERAAGTTGAVAVVGFADSQHPGLVGYLSNYLTAGALATLICVPGAELTLVAGLGGGRDHPFIKGMTFVNDVRWFPQLGAGICEVLAERGVTAGPLAVAGLDDCFAHARAEALLAALSAFEVVPFDEGLDSLRRTKREREIGALRAGRAILHAAGEALVQSWRAHRDLHRALTEAEKVAKFRGARDFRALAVASDGSWRPWPDATSWGVERYGVYLAVEYLGYWADLGLSGPESDGVGALAEIALDVAERALREGSSGASLHLALRDELGADARVVTLEASGVGTSLVETPRLSDEDEELARVGDLVGLRAWVARERVAAVATRAVLVGNQSATNLEAPMV